MTSGAAIDEDRATDRYGAGVLGQLIDGLARIELKRVIEACILRRRLHRPFRLRTPMPPTLERAQPIPDQVTDGEHQGDIEQVDPPTRQRLVVLGEVAVPYMTGFIRPRIGGAALDVAPEQPDAAQQVQHRDGHYVP